MSPSRLPNRPAWYITQAILLAGFIGLSLFFRQQTAPVSAETDVSSALDLRYEGNDWVQWRDSEEGIIARNIHPLIGYKRELRGRFIREGDKLRKIDYHEIYQAEVADQLMESAPPGKGYIFQVERTDPATLVSEKVNLLIETGFRLGFSFNSIPLYWRVSFWLMVAGLFSSSIILLILLPVLKGDWYRNLSLLAVVLAGLSVLLLLVTRNLYLVVENDLTQTGFEKIFLLLFSTLLTAYGLSYAVFKSGGKFPILVLGFAIPAALILVRIYQIVFVFQELQLHFDRVESAVLSFFLLLVAGGLLLHLFSGSGKKARPQAVELLALLLTLGLGATYLFFLIQDHIPSPAGEHLLFGFYLIFFFPLMNVAFFPLRFGKVSLVLTQTIQYLIFFFAVIFFWFILHQVFGYFMGENPYRQIAELITLVALVLIGRSLFLKNEGRFRKYFISTQQEKTERLRSFMARVPQYTSAQKLFSDMRKELADLFEPDQVRIWWQGDLGAGLDAMVPIQEPDHVFQVLSEKSAPWARIKQLSPVQMPEELEVRLQNCPYALIAPLSVNPNNFGLLLLGRKKRGVYNLSDLELVSQLSQRIQLTLNVLQLVQREKELMQKTYEANLTALRSQINPHFLFNTLNTISALIHDAPDTAEEAIEKLAFIFRYTLQVSDRNFVPMADELRLVTTYLDIEKIRFGDRLNLDIRLEKEVEDVLIPAFVIQTLIENAIKHGIARKVGKGVVRIHARAEADLMVCEIFDNGPGIDADRIGAGTGLNNIIARLENIYELKNLLSFENTGNGTQIFLKIPRDHAKS